MTTAFTDETLMAFVDGELDDITAGRVLRAAAADRDVDARIVAQRRLREALAARFDPILEEPVKARFRALLGDNVVPFQPKTRGPVRLGWREAAAVAATFAAGFLASQLTAPPPGLDEGPAHAAGRLEAALETQLASAQEADAPVRIGVTFASADGRTCRTFETQATAGLACRGADSWGIVAAAAARPEGTGEYRQAGSGAAWVMQHAQEMMAGDPLDAAAERVARDRRWRRNDRVR
jgi:hypothetical protein